MTMVTKLFFLTHGHIYLTLKVCQNDGTVCIYKKQTVTGSLPYPT